MIKNKFDDSGKKIALVIKKIAEIHSNIAFGSASIWGIYQMKEPKNLLKK